MFASRTPFSSQKGKSWSNRFQRRYYNYDLFACSRFCFSLISMTEYESNCQPLWSTVWKQTTSGLTSWKWALILKYMKKCTGLKSIDIFTFEPEIDNFFNSLSILRSFSSYSGLIMTDAIISIILANSGNTLERLSFDDSILTKASFLGVARLTNLSYLAPGELFDEAWMVEFSLQFEGYCQAKLACMCIKIMSRSHQSFLRQLVL